jgi:ABC-type transport system involved in multi-copper enzyme maturation permease subunit
MLASSLTLLNRSLREDSRLLRPHLLRALIVAFIFAALLLALASGSRVGAPGLRFFRSLAHMNLWFITLAGVSYFATAITEEKEEMTLGLLRMAGIGPVSLLLGKSTSRLIGGIVSLSVQFPFTLLAITLGGVTWQQVFGVYVALLAYLLFVANLGLLCSVLRKRSTGASRLTGILLALIVFCPWFFGWALGASVRAGWLAPNAAVRSFEWLFETLSAASIWGRLSTIMATGFDESPISFQVVANLLGAAACFTLAWGAFNAFVRDEQPATPGRGALFLRGGRLNPFRAGRPWANALIWKDFNFIGGGLGMLLVKLLVYGGLIFGLIGLGVYYSPYPIQTREVIETIGSAFLLAMPLAAAIESALFASRIFRDEAQWKTLSSILMLPGTIPQIIYPKVAGCLLALTPAGLYFCLGAFLNPQVLTEFLRDSLDQPMFWCFLISYFVFLHLAAFLSLVIKWGALPLAFGIVYLLPGFCMSALFTAVPLRDADGFAVMLAFFGLIAMSVLHVGIGERLRWVAAR